MDTRIWHTQINTSIMASSKAHLRVEPQVWWTAAAALVLAVMVWLYMRPPLHERLYAKYRRFPEASFITPGGSTAQPYLQVAAETFNSRDYRSALTQLNTYHLSNPQDTKVRLFVGLCYLELQQHDDARAVFQQITKYDKVWANEAYWYMALSYLRENKRIDCIRAMGGVRADSELYPNVLVLWERIR